MNAVSASPSPRDHDGMLAHISTRNQSIGAAANIAGNAAASDSIGGAAQADMKIILRFGTGGI